MKRIIFAILIFGISLNGFTQQGVSITTDNSPPHESAMLDIDNSNKGILIPRVQLDDVITATPVANPANGLLIFNDTGTEMHGFYYWDGTVNRWRALNHFTESGNGFL